MVIPSVDENIRLLMSGGAKSPIERSRMSDGQPLFTKEDVCQPRNNDLDIELRYICDYFRIGRSYFNDRAVEYFNQSRHDKEKAKSDTQNLVRTLEKGGITNNRFEETLRALGLEIVDRSVTVKDEAGDRYTFSTSEALRESQKSNV